MEFNIIKKITRGKLFGKEQEICDLYFNQHKSLNEVSRILECDNKFIRLFFKNNNLKTRSVSEGRIHKNIIGNEDDIKKLYESGWASKDIGVKYGVDLGAIINCLNRMGVKIRTASEARKTKFVIEKDKRRRIKFKDEEVQQIIELYISGYGAQEIGIKFGYDGATIKRILIENDIQFRSMDSMFTDRVKRKAKDTFFGKYGSWKERNIYLNKKFQEKYGDGLTGAMQVGDFFHTQQESGFKLKTVVIDGMSVKYRGYELKALQTLLSEGYDISDIVIGKGVPTIRYSFDGRDNRVYYPDIFIPKDNRIIEVKSIWTYRRHLDMNLAKEKAVKDAGYIFSFYIMDEDGRKLNI